MVLRSLIKQGIILFTVKFNPDIDKKMEASIVGKKLFDVFYNIDKSNSSLYECMEKEKVIERKGQLIKNLYLEDTITDNISFPIRHGGLIVGAIELSKVISSKGGHYKEKGTSDGTAAMNFSPKSLNLGFRASYTLVNLIYGADINYDHLQDVNTKIRNIKYTIKLKKSNLQWKIEAIDSDEYGAKYFKDKMKVKSLFDINESKKIAIKQALEEVKKAAIEMNKNIQNSYKNLNISEAEEGTLNGTVGIAATVSYNRDTAIEYARKYALNNAPFFYSASSDCTNFVSQCVWAGYGGWDPTGSDSVNRTRVNNKYRMTSTWYGGTGGGSSSWESVNSFYSYVNSNTGTGPRGTVYEEDKSVGSFNYSAIAKGDVLQGWPDSQNRYYHSIFISAVLKPGIPAEILYCSHSTARQDELLTKFTQWVGSGKMRGIRFNSTTY